MAHMGAKWLKQSDLRGILMRAGLRVAVMVGLGIALGAGTASFGADVADDPYLWLEDIQGQKPLEWVKQRNDVALKQLKSDPNYQKNYDAILAVLDATDRIPFGQVYYLARLQFLAGRNPCPRHLAADHDRILRNPIAAMGDPDRCR